MTRLAPHARLAAALCAVLLLSGPVAARQADPDPGYDKAFARGAARPAPAKTLDQEARCSAAWAMAWTIIWINRSAVLPSGYDRAGFEAQSQAWYDRVHEQGPAGEDAHQKADDEIIQPLAAAGQRQKIFEIAGACGRTQ